MNLSRDELDLDWLAFCYAAGELDATQAATFEALLATSQEARERLAAVVALSQHVADVPLAAPTVVQPARSGRHVYERLAWLSLGAALLLAAIWVGRNFVNDQGPALPAGTGSGDAELASAWAESFDAPSEAIPEEDASGESHADASSSAADTSTEELLNVPDWMFAALGGDEIGDETMPDETNGDRDEPTSDSVDGAMQEG